MKKMLAGAAAVFVLLFYSSSFGYLGMSLEQMEKAMGAPAKKANANSYIFESRVKKDNRILKIKTGDLIKIEAVFKDNKVVSETIFLPNKLDNQKDVLNWIWTYTGGRIRDINRPKTKVIREAGGEKAYYFTGGYWAVPHIDPSDGTVVSITLGKQ